MANEKELEEGLCLESENKVMNSQISGVDLEAGELSIINENLVKKESRKPREHNYVKVNLSKSLHNKLKHKAQAEGVSLEDFASELLAEGLVLRAWEIMERKSTMRQNANGNTYNNSNNRSHHKQSYRNNNSNNNGYRGRSASQSNGHFNGQHGAGRRGNYQHILEDNANFLEYVRSQEKKNT